MSQIAISTIKTNVSIKLKLARSLVFREGVVSNVDGCCRTGERYIIIGALQKT